MILLSIARRFPCLLLVVAFAAPAAGQAPAAQSTTTTTSQTAVTQDEVVLQGDTTPRPALPTYYGDTGLWFVSTAETLPAGRWSFSAFRANFDRRQGLTDIAQFGVTGAAALGNRVELFGSWRAVRIDRDVRPFFVTSDRQYGGVANEYPYMRRGWSKDLGGPAIVGGKVSLISQSRGDVMSLAPRVMVKFPTGSTWASTNDVDGYFDLIASREFGRQVELTGQAGGVFRASSDQFRTSDGVAWGVGAGFPSRSRLRALVEWHGEFFTNDNTVVIGPAYVAEDGSVAPLSSRNWDTHNVKVGGVWQASNGIFAHGGMNYSFGVGGRTVGTFDIAHSGWGADVRLGWHPGVTPPRERVRVIKETTTVTNTTRITPPPAPAPAAAAPAPANRNPTFTVNATCNPCILEPGQTSSLTAMATDPDGDPVTYAWTAPQGTFANANAANTAWTAPGQEGNVPATVAARDNRGGAATSSVTLQVVRRETIVFEDVHFDFDRFSLRPDALRILDAAIPKLQANPALQVTIEGHCDSVGTLEYNIALGERRSISVRDYLVNRGIAAARLRTVSYGEERPIDDNDTAAGRAMNRRAHLAVIIQ